MRISDWSSDVCSSDLRLVAKPALWGVDDPLEREIVVRLHNDAQISHGVADFGAFVETETTDDPVGQADADEAVFELAGLELGADQDGAILGLAAATDVAFDLLADEPRFLGSVPDADAQIGRAHV